MKHLEVSVSSLHCVKSGHDVVGSLEELKNTVLELLFLVSGELVVGVALLNGLLSANAEHLRH